MFLVALFDGGGLQFWVLGLNYIVHGHLSIQERSIGLNQSLRVSYGDEWRNKYMFWAN